MQSKPSTENPASPSPKASFSLGRTHIVLQVTHLFAGSAALSHVLHAYLLQETLPKGYLAIYTAIFGGAALLDFFFAFLYYWRPSLAYFPISPFISIIVGALYSLIIQVLCPILEISSFGLLAVFGFFVITLPFFAKRVKHPLLGYVILILLPLVLQYGVRPFVGFLEPTEVTHGEVPALIWKLAVMSWAGFLLVIITRQQEFLEASLQHQERLLASLESLRAESEARREEAEARYREAEALRSQLEAAIRQATLTARYEALMRASYGLELSAFLRRLLEHLQEDLSFVAGAAYLWQGRAGKVVATYAVPEQLGQRAEGGPLQTAADLRQPYEVKLSALAKAPLVSHVVPLVPRYALYLPLWAQEAGQETLAVLELLFLSPPPKAHLSAFALILPRLGSYLWLHYGKPA